MLPANVKNWLEGASRVRMRREIELATAEANSMALDKRRDWLHERKQQLQFQHEERMADAEKRYPPAMATAEEEFCKRLVMEFDGRYQ